VAGAVEEVPGDVLEGSARSELSCEVKARDPERLISFFCLFGAGCPYKCGSCGIVSGLLGRLEGVVAFESESECTLVVKVTQSNAIFVGFKL
jgi:hypothetical protein